MSKLFKLFYLIIFITSIFYFIIFQFSEDALADQITIDDSRIKVTQDPLDAQVNSGQVILTVSATQPILLVGNYYARIENTTGNSCQKNATFTNQDPQKITFAYKILPGCGSEVGVRRFQLWFGSAFSATPIVVNYIFTLGPVGGGGIPLVVPLNQNLALSETPEIEIQNVKSGTHYLFWWQAFGNITLVKNYTATSDGNSGKISLTDYKKGFPDPTTPTPKTLCMEAGNDQPTALGLTCRYPTTFTFTTLPAPPSGAQPACSPNPPSPTENQPVSVKAINLPKNQDFQALFIIQKSQTQNSGDSGVVSIPLAAFLPIGDYGVKVYNTSSPDLVCEVKFTVGPATAAVNPAGAIKQTLTVTICEAGDNPGIKTAIGCVHTSAFGFSKDFLKFAIGISGGLAFLMMLLGAFQMLTSAGNPETLAGGRDKFTSAIVGLLMVIFAVLLLRIIGFDILGLPGLG